jgi:signal transduction histidine kinase/CheY-like chemotaxis protein
MDSRSNSNYKIFKSLFYLNYKDPKLESNYRKKGKLASSKMLGIFVNVIFFYSLFLCIFETVLGYYAASYNGNIIKWNIIFVYLNLVPITLNFLIFHFKSSFLEKKFFNRISVFLLFFCFLNDNLSITSILRVYYKSRIELVSFVFLMKVLMLFLISFFVIRKFAKALTIISLNIIFHYIFLLQLHVIREVLLYLIIETIFAIIVIMFIYMSEYWGRVFYYSYSKLEKEKKDNLETLKFFNISYFKTKNYEVTNHAKLDELLIFNTPKIQDGTGHIYTTNYHVTIKKIEYLFKNLISLDTLPKEIETYLSETQFNNSFKFKKFIEIVKKFEKLPAFENYMKIGVFKLRNHLKEESYFQLFLKIKIKTKNEGESKDSSFIEENFLLEKENIKIEGIFMDVTQSFMKRQTQVNSLILSKSIHDIKSPLFLLKQVIKKYEKQNSIISEQIVQLINSKGIGKGSNTNFNFNYNENLFTLNDFSLNNGSPQLNSHISKPLLDENCKYKEISETLTNLHTHSQYLKIISKNIFENINSINAFTKQQNNYEEKTEIHNKAFYFKKVNIKKLIKSCIEFYKISVKYNPAKNNIKILAEIDEKIPNFIYTNKIAVKQVLMNLISNSLKFTNFGEIRIVANFKLKYELEEKRYIEITVVDTGCGIDDENISKLCTPFGITTSDKYGSGLGLSIVHDFLSQVNSKLNIYSKKNKGSAFSFDLLIDKNYEGFSDDEADSSCSIALENSNLSKKGYISCKNMQRKRHSQTSLRSVQPSSVIKNESIRTISSANSSEESDAEESLEKTFSTIPLNYLSEPLDKFKIMGEDLIQKLYPISNVASPNRSPLRSQNHSPILSPNLKSPVIRSPEGSPPPGQSTPYFNPQPMHSKKKFMTVVTKNSSKRLKKILIAPRKNISKFSKDSGSAKNKNFNLPEEAPCNYPPQIEIHSKKASENEIFSFLPLKKDSNNSIIKRKSLKTNSTGSNRSNVENGVPQSLNRIQIINKIFNSHCSRTNLDKNKLKILIIDDDPIYIKQLCGLINNLATELECFIKIDSCFNPIEGIIKIYTLLTSHNEYYDLLLIDEQMPYMKGSCFSIMYKSNLVSNGFYPLKIVTMSSEVVSHLKINNLNQTFDYFLDKPCKKSDLKKILEKLIYSKMEFH